MAVPSLLTLSGFQAPRSHVLVNTRVPGRARSRMTGRSRRMSSGNSHIVTTVASRRSASKALRCSKRTRSATPSRPGALIGTLDELLIDVHAPAPKARVHPRGGQRDQAVARAQVDDHVVIAELGQRQQPLRRFRRARLKEGEALLRRSRGRERCGDDQQGREQGELGIAVHGSMFYPIRTARRVSR